MVKLAAICNGIVEAAWLVALVTLPLFFSVLGERIQNEKNYLLRALAIALLTAWAIRLLAQFSTQDEPGTNPGRLARMFGAITSPLPFSMCLVALSWVLSTCLSLSPWDSFWGTSGRREGSFTNFSALAFAAAIAVHVKTPEQVARILLVIALTSVPICFYGIGQRFAVDPTLFHGTTGFEFRVGSTFTNPAFLAAYLVMILPLTLYQAAVHITNLKDGKKDLFHWAHLAALALVAFLQLLTLSFTVSRGALFGLLNATVIVSLVFAIYGQRRRIVLATIAGLLVILGVSVLVILPNGPFPSLRSRPTVQRFTEMLDPKTGSSGRYAIWNVAAQTATFSKPVLISEGKTDPLHRLRFLVGFGPEHIRAGSAMHRSVEYNIAMGDQPFFDRVHNEVWDTLISTGFLGLAAHLTLTSVVIFFCMQHLGLLGTSRHRRIFWLSYVGTAIASSTAWVSWLGAGFFGLGLRLGMVAGLMAFLVWTAIASNLRSVDKPAKEWAWLVIALLAGVVSHLVEISFSFTIETTLLYFWVFLGLLLALGKQDSASEIGPTPGHPQVLTTNATAISSTGQQRTVQQPPPKRKIPMKNGDLSEWRPELVGGFLLALILANVGSMLILTHWKGGFSAAQIVFESFTRLPGSQASVNWSLSLSTLLSILVFGIAWIGFKQTGAFQPNRTRSLAIIIIVGFALACAYWLLLAGHTTRMIASSRATLDILDRFLDGYIKTADLSYGFTFLVLLCVGALLSEVRHSPASSAKKYSKPIAMAAAAVAVAGITLIMQGALNWSKAGVIMNRAEYFRRKGQWSLMRGASEAAIARLPSSDYQYVALGEAMGEEASKIQDPTLRQAAFLSADKVLEKGHALRPLASHFFGRRADLYLKWAQTESAAEKRKQFAKTAIDFYKRAAAMDPGNFDLWNRMAMVELMAMWAPGQAHPWLDRAMELNPASDKTYCLRGDAYYNQALAMADTNQARVISFQAAATNYAKSLQLANPRSPEAFRYSLALGRSFINLKQIAPAIDAFKTALDSAPPGEGWVPCEMLGRLYADAMDKTNSLLFLERAIQIAPTNKLFSLLQLKTNVLSHR